MQARRKVLSGFSADVKPVYDASLRGWVALKKYRVDGNGSKDHSITHELNVLTLGQGHPNIVQLIQYDCTPTEHTLTLEWMKGGDLYRRLKSYPSTIDQKNGWLRQILCGVCFLHQQSIALGDLKLDNILVSRDAKTVKLCDFATSVPEGTKISGMVGTANYIPVEYINGSKTMTRAADIWSLGVLMCELFTMKAPFSHGLAVDDLNVLIFNITRAQYKLPEELPSGVRELVEKCLQLNPDDRPTAAYIMNTLYSK